MEFDCYLSSGEYPEDFVVYMNYLLDQLGLKELGKNLSLSEIEKILDKKKITWSSYDGTKKELVYEDRRLKVDCHTSMSNLT
jgi:hypothetical protein